VVDFDPLRIKREWTDAVCKAADLPVYEVDGHNIVPCWAASNKLEYGAYTIRPKIKRRLGEFLRPLPPMRRHRYPSAELDTANDWAGLEKSLDINGAVRAVEWIKPGEEARKALARFTRRRIHGYAAGCNDPASPNRSDLSPYLHFGQAYSLRVALEVEKSDAGAEDKEAFLEELIVRKELSDNFCLHQPGYDSLEGFPRWARATLDKHRADRREYVYAVDAFESASTHDELWNAAQTEMVRRGKMHGYLRMYWAKKILEWSATPEEALATAIYLNDRYELDGRDPNGYAGVAWSIGGVHDRAWAERKVFGKIRYMSYDGCRRKFDVERYVDYASAL
jgi:deoxyribodipyrimidine photo-lyase